MRGPGGLVVLEWKWLVKTVVNTDVKSDDDVNCISISLHETLYEYIKIVNVDIIESSRSFRMSSRG